ncbi:nitroreductase family protein [Xanthomonas sp. NCPPB 3005]|jgi:nitroreductase|uniref:nitroreductase family protein n=1 Tax=Xanthomonas sp. NCPPB 3005 TaxID=3240913 RepID=UPI0035111FC9
MDINVNNQAAPQRWVEFQATNRFRRAIRDFDSKTIPEEDVRALLGEAVFAPSSGNLQPYQFHWIRSAQARSDVAAACNGQKAASSAADLIVVVASPDIARRTAHAQLSHVERSATLELKSKAYHRKQVGKFLKILGIGGLPVWSPILAVAALIRPALSLLPVGHIGSRHWTARNAAFAAHTLMLAAAARGIDSCPMEGFSASNVAKALHLPRGTVIPLIIALGYRADHARIEERWRRPMDEVVVTH